MVFLGKYIEKGEEKKLALRREISGGKKAVTASHPKQQPSLMKIVERVSPN